MDPRKYLLTKLIAPDLLRRGSNYPGQVELNTEYAISAGMIECHIPRKQHMPNLAGKTIGKHVNTSIIATRYGPALQDDAVLTAAVEEPAGSLQYQGLTALTIAVGIIPTVSSWAPNRDIFYAVCNNNQVLSRITAAANGNLGFRVYNESGVATLAQSGASSWAAGSLHHVVGRWRGDTGANNIWFDGVQMASGSAVTGYTRSGTSGASVTFLYPVSNAYFLYFYAWNRYLDDSEIIALNLNPYQMLKPRLGNGVAYFPAPAGGVTSIGAALEPLILSSYSATVGRSNDITAALESLALSANTGKVSSDRAISSQQEALQITANSAAVALDVSISGVLEVLAITTNSASVSTGANIAAQTESLQAATNQASISADNSINAALESLALTSSQAQISTGLVANTEQLTLGSFLASISSDRAISGQVEALQISTAAASVALGSAVAAGIESLQIQTSAATITLDTGISAALESLVLSELAAQITLSQQIGAQIESLSITASGATLVLDTGITATLESLTLSAFDAVLTIPTGEIDAPGLGYKLKTNRLHYKLPINKLHFTFKR